MRSLAHIEQITNIRPIEGCDNICQANVLGWNLIIKKDEFKEGDKCIYIEIDSVVDKNNPSFAFLEKKNWKIKTIKMKGVLSQGIAFPLSILPKQSRNCKIGTDVTSVLKITQVEDDVPQDKKPRKQKKIIRFLMKFKLFRCLFKKVLFKSKSLQFPSWITKTDEVRLQNRPDILEKYKGNYMIVSEKVDGTSSTFALNKINKKKYEFIVCSRNNRQAHTDKKSFDGSNVYWEIAFKYNIEDALKAIAQRYDASKVVLQGEIIGNKIQKNKYELADHDLYVFNLDNDGVKFNYVMLGNIIKQYGLKTVPVIDDKFILKNTVDEMIEYADGESKLYPTLREGVVIRDHFNTVSFKCISNKFLLKHKL